MHPNAILQEAKQLDSVNDRFPCFCLLLFLL